MSIRQHSRHRPEATLEPLVSRLNIPPKNMLAPTRRSPSHVAFRLRGGEGTRSNMSSAVLFVLARCRACRMMLANVLRTGLQPERDAWPTNATAKRRQAAGRRARRGAHGASRRPADPLVVPASRTWRTDTANMHVPRRLARWLRCSNWHLRRQRIRRRRAGMRGTAPTRGRNLDHRGHVRRGPSPLTQSEMPIPSRRGMAIAWWAASTAFRSAACFSASRCSVGKPTVPRSHCWVCADCWRMLHVRCSMPRLLPIICLPWARGKCRVPCSAARSPCWLKWTRPASGRWISRSA